jgi:hypothetical protein
MKKNAPSMIVEIKMSLPGSLKAGFRVFIDLLVFRIDAGLLPTLSYLKVINTTGKKQIENLASSVGFKDNHKPSRREEKAEKSYGKC